MNTAFNTHLSPASRVWIYASDRAFTPAEADLITKAIADFTKGWTSHKVGVAGDGALLYNRFVVLAADESHTGVSGCSIDSSVRFIKQLGQQYGADFFNRLLIFYTEGKEVQCLEKDLFLKKLEGGELSPDTHVFNPLLQTVADFETKWLQPVAQSWVTRLAPAAGSLHLKL